MEIVFAFIFSTIFGSFANVCIYRIPEGKSIVNPPSSCGTCGSRLKFIDMIPVISFFLLRGKCRICRTPFSIQYPLVELFSGIIFSLLYYKYGFTVQLILFAYFSVLLIIVMMIDLKHKIIPDELVIAGITGGIAAFIYNIFTALPIYRSDFWYKPLLGIIPGTAVLFLIVLIGSLIYKNDEAMGMGDVKIFIPIGLFLGWEMCMLALIISVVSAGIFSMMLVIAGIMKRKDTIPFGPFIVAGTFISMIWGWDIVLWYLGR